MDGLLGDKLGDNRDGDRCSLRTSTDVAREVGYGSFLIQGAVFWPDNEEVPGSSPGGPTQKSPPDLRVQGDFPVIEGLQLGDFGRIVSKKSAGGNGHTGRAVVIVRVLVV
jgi:hypothetical protein